MTDNPHRHSAAPATPAASTLPTDTLPSFVQDRATALIARDWAQLESLLAEDLCYVHATGMRHDKAEYLRFVQAGNVWRSVRLLQPQVWSNGSITVVKGLLSQVFERGAGTAPVEANSWATEVWRKDDHWRLMAFQSTRCSST